MALREFSWVLPGELAGMARPDGLEEDVEALRAAGVGAVVNLGRHDLEGELLARAGIAYLHLYVPDFAPPMPEQVYQFVEFCDRHIGEGRAVAAHCVAGRGRTGTMLACYLVHRGRTADEAIGRVRRLRPGSIETFGQEQAVRQYAADVRRGQ